MNPLKDICSEPDTIPLPFVIVANASEPPNETELPAILIDELESFEFPIEPANLLAAIEPANWVLVTPLICSEPLTTPSGKIATTLPLVTVPTVVMFPCVKCSFALYPVVDDSVICAELDTTSWLSNCCLTSATQPSVWSALICPEPDTIPVPL